MKWTQFLDLMQKTVLKSDIICQTLKTVQASATGKWPDTWWPDKWHWPDKWLGEPIAPLLLGKSGRCFCIELHSSRPHWKTKKKDNYLKYFKEWTEDGALRWLYKICHDTHDWLRVLRVWCDVVNNGVNRGRKLHLFYRKVTRIC